MNSVLEQFNIKGRSALVTGAASGIGLAYVEALAESGARVTLTDRKGDVAEIKAKELCDKGYDVRSAQLDVRNKDQVKDIFDEHVRVYGGLDIVFANAGSGAGVGWKDGQGQRTADGQIDSIDPEVWKESLSVNLDGVINTVKNAARIMKQFGQSGSIIVTTSNASTITVPVVCTAYMVAKSAVAHMVRNVSLELAGFNIRINAIAPGSIVTNIGGGHLHLPEVQEAWRKMIPLGRMGETNNLKPLALYLASDASSFVTGTEMLIDGGVSLVSSF